MELKDNPGLLAALSTLVILQLVMLFALFAETTPHPPEVTPLFGMAPFVGVSVAVAVAAAICGPKHRIGAGLCIAAAVLAALSFGPQKYFDAQIALVWPAVVTGQVAIVAVIYATITSRRAAA